mgnify:CR=1 FL=1|tara:strand:- start:45654 stop:46391 length:738 start_codon:yes stop_codon:yes gene_type:complete
MEINQNPTNYMLNNNLYIPLSWFPLGKKKLVEKECKILQNKGKKKIRIGIDYSNGVSKRNTNWHKWLLMRLAVDFEVEPCLLFSHRDHMSTLSKRKHSLIEAIEGIVHECGDSFDCIGLYRSAYERYSQDTDANIFSQEFIFAINWAKHLGKRVHLGGICPEDFNWIINMITFQVLKNVSVISLDPIEVDRCRSHKYFYEILKSLLHAKGLDIEIRDSGLAYFNNSLERKESKSALLNTSLKITG